MNATERKNLIKAFMLVTFAYVISGRLGLLLAIPPGYASAIFPPSGIALAASLVFGWQICPAIFLGSFALNIWMSVETTGASSILSSLLLAAGIAGGATAQALFGRLLIKRRIGFPNALETEQAVSKFLILGGPVACLVNATIGPACLLIAGMISTQQFLANWMTWWIGDTLGALVVAPAFLIFWGSPREAWVRRRVSVGVPLLLSFLLSTIFFIYSSRSQQDAIEKEFQSRSADLAATLEKVINSHQDALLALERHFHFSDQISMDEFREVSRSWLKSHPDIQKLSWIPRIPVEDLRDFEKATRESGSADFAVFELDASGRNIPVAARDEYFPILFMESRSPDTPVLGFDLGSESVRQNAMQKARDSGQLQVATLRQLVQDTDPHPSILLIQPVYAADRPANLVQPRHKLRGFISAVARFDDMLQATLQRTQYEGLTISLLTGDGNWRELLPFKSSSDGAGRHSQLFWNSSLDLAGQVFQLRIRANSSYSSGHNEGTAWAFMVLGLLFTALLGAFLLATTGRQEITRRSEENFRFLAETIPHLVWTTTVDGAVEFFNSRWSSYTGLDLKNSMGNPDLIHPDDLVGLREIWKHSTTHGQLFDMEYRLRRHDGEFRWHLARALPQRNCYGTIIRWFGTCTDIHDQKLKSQELESTRIALELAQESTQVATWEFDLSSSELTRAPFLDQLFGFEEKVPKWSEELFFRCIHPEDRSEVMQIMEKASSSDASGYAMQFRVLWPDGTVRWLGVLARFVRNEAAEITHHRGATFDISSLKLAEEERTRSAVREQAAVESSLLKSEFLASMSHEIRTPINGVIGMTGLLLDTPLSSEQRDYADAIKLSGDALLTVINDILDFSKIEARKLDFEDIDFPLVQSLEDARLTIAFSAQKKGLKFESEMDPDLPLYVKGDPGRLRQILTNLLSNAVKFTSKGSICLRANCLERDEASATIKFEVCDTGIGISKETCDSLFQPFTQADSSTTRRFGGSGLGLSICKHLTEKMGGRIGVESQVGMGSKFWFILQLELGVREIIPSSSTERAKSSPYIKGRRARILVVEDVAINQTVALHLLEKMGYAAHAVANGKEALAALHQSSYDLVLMDCHMPEMDGYEATRLIRSSLSIGNSQLPIIAMTANAMKGDMEKCLVVGMNDYVTKPFQAMMLQAVIQKWLPGDVEDQAKAV